MLRTHKNSPPDSRTRWNGVNFPFADAAQLERLARYPRVSLTRNALFAVAMGDYAAFRQHGSSARKPAAE